MCIRAHKEAGALLVEQSVGLGRRGVRCRRSDRLSCGKDREITGTGHARLPDFGNAMRQYRQQLPGLVEVELEELALRISRHRLRLSKLGDERGIARHRHANQLVGDRDAMKRPPHLARGDFLLGCVRL